MSQEAVTKNKKCELVPINLHNAEEFEELLRQRVVCGWDNTVEMIESWRSAMDQKTKGLFWITAVDKTRIGHISLDSISRHSAMVLPNKAQLTINTFFVHPSHRSNGYGGVAMRILESYATKEPYGSPNCKAIALNAISRKYTEDDGEEWRPLYVQCGRVPMPKGGSNEDWYKRLGYEKFRDDEFLYPDRKPDGTEHKWLACCLRKELW